MNLKRINNNDVSLSNYSGRVIILDFWATWCGPCKLELPGYIELYNTYKNKGLVIIGVTIWWDSIDEIVSSIQTNKINYPVLIGNDSVCNLYGGIDGVPTTLIINPQGQIVKTMIGYDNKKAFEDEINKWLQNTSPFILSTSPENKETNVPIDTIIQAVFNKDINSTAFRWRSYI
ncbi:redoxin domain-containing protein [Candidatus Desantisbacteria bacterium]|nr:redoxin domain-containing protein [Candidatus Desantisbacteria bacterium]